MNILKRYIDGEWEPVVVGAAGPIGPQGPTGPQGPPGEAGVLDDLTDVDVSGAETGNALVYDNGTQLWTPGAVVAASDYAQDKEEFNSTFQKQIRQIDFMTVQPLGNATTFTQLGSAVTAAGTAGAVNVATAGIFARQRRIRYTTGGTNGNNAGWRHPHLQYFTGRGFTFTCEFGFVTGTPNKRTWFGFTGVNAATVNTAYDANNAAFANCFFVGSDTTDTNLCVYHNGPTGVMSRIDLGSDFPANTGNSDWYGLRITGRTDQFDVSHFDYKVTNRSTGKVTEGTVSELNSSGTPAGGTLLTWRMLTNRAGTTNAVDLGFVWVEMEFNLD